MDKSLLSKLFGFFMLLIFVGVGLVYFRKASGPQPPTSTPTVAANPTPTIKQSKENIAAKMGENFSIVLWGNASTGYEWKFDYDPNYIKFIDKKFETLAEEKGVVGTPSKGTYIFSSLKSGEIMITALYLKPSEKGVPPEEIVIYQVKITSSTD